jgi:hypothetical protein
MSPARQDQLSSTLLRASRTFLAAKRQLLYVSSSILPKLGLGRVQPGEILRLSCHVPELRLFLFNQAHQRYRPGRDTHHRIQSIQADSTERNLHAFINTLSGCKREPESLSLQLHGYMLPNTPVIHDLSWRLCRFRCRYASGIKLQPYHVANTILKLPIIGQC